MLIGFNLAPVVANIYWPQDQWVALLVMIFAIVCGVALRGFAGRIAIFLSLIFGYVLSWIFDKVFGQITSLDPGVGKITTHFRTNFDNVAASSWFGLPPSTGTLGADGKAQVGWHAPSISMAAVLLVIPAVIALIAENTGHVKAVAEMTGADLDDVMGRAIAADGVGTMIASSVGGSPRRPMPRISASWRPPGCTRRPRTTPPHASRSSSASRRSSARSSPRCPVGCSVGSPWSSTA